ncbi:MAG TPA: hypothetical protein VHN17_01105 [Steroidobacteraceae bacterium]|jgi:hypothetical protein|nr:hypothetical protein [Steroidobacteraceae bacterium]
MLQLFRSLLGETSRDHQAGKPASKPASTGRHKPPQPSVDYRAVSLAPNIMCDAVSKDVAGKRYLLREAPRLPLAGCATPASCSCKFRKHADRRNGDRRLLGMAETNRWYAGGERRNRGGRRTKPN